MKRHDLLVVLAVALVAALAVGCEDTGLTAPVDGTIVVRANPSTVVIDPNVQVEDPPGSGIFVPQSSATTTIRAQVFDADGAPQQGIQVVLSTSGGTLASASNGGNALRTNASGVVEDVLTVTTTDPNTVEVEASSSSVTGKVQITKTVTTANRPPQGAVVITPRTEQQVGDPVVFDGSASADPDDDLITMYRWTLTSNNPDPGQANPLVIEDPGANSFDRIFQNVQDIAGSLQVTDDPLAVQKKAAGQPIQYLGATPFAYRIVQVVCSSNRAPVAVIVGDTFRQVGAINTTISIPLDGTPSSDPDDVGIDSYSWACGNGRAPIPQGNGSKVVCQYTVAPTSQTYTATLIVRDKGTGVIGSNGSYECALSSEPDSATVTIEPSTTP